MTGEDELKNIVAFVPDTTILSIGLSGTGTLAEGVPADSQRFVYFMKLWNPGGATIVSVYQSFGGVLTLEDQQELTQNQTLQIPQAGPSLQPVQRYLGSSFIRVQLSSPVGSTTSGVGVTLQIVDKPSGGM